VDVVTVLWEWGAVSGFFCDTGRVSWDEKRCVRGGGSVFLCETGGVSEGREMRAGFSMGAGGAELWRRLSGARSRFCQVAFRNSSTLAASSSASLVFWM